MVNGDSDVQVSLSAHRSVDKGKDLKLKDLAGKHRLGYSVMVYYLQMNKARIMLETLLVCNFLQGLVGIVMSMYIKSFHFHDPLGRNPNSDPALGSLNQRLAHRGGGESCPVAHKPLSPQVQATIPNKQGRSQRDEMVV